MEHLKLPDQQAVVGCNAMYASTMSFYKEIQPQITEADCGFRILFGPPIVAPPIMFIGYQPGGDKEHVDHRHHYGWPSVCEYAVDAEWPLAKGLRKIFGAEFLKECVGTNAIFLRAPTEKYYRKKVNAKVRKRIESFCHSHIESLIATLRPHTIVFIGLGAMGLFDRGQPALLGANNRVLARSGSVAGCPALGVLHLTGAHISTDDRLKIEARLRDARHT